MIKAAGGTGATMIPDLATAIIRDGKVPTDWEQSFIVCLYKGKGDALDRGNYRGLKLNEQAMKILERIVVGPIRQVVSIDDSQFGFVPERGTTSVEESIVRLVQGMYANARSRVLVGKAFSQEFEVKVGSTRDTYSVPYSSSLCWRPSALSCEFPAGVHWEDNMQMTLISLVTYRNVSGGSYYGKKPWRRRG